MCATLALRHADPAGSGRAVASAVDWVRKTQRTDGAWGRWGDTAEETAYALHILLGAAFDASEAVVDCAARGYEYLTQTLGQSAYPKLWHDKDLYVPYAIVDAAVLSAIHLAQSHPRLAAHVRSRSHQPSVV
jgi:hypothetical protein